MIEDRDYMRSRASFEPQWSVTILLIIVNTVVFLIQSLADSAHLHSLREYFALSVTGLKQGYLWQLLTFQFLHMDILHVAGNLITLFFFGRAVEEALGKSNFLKLYLLTGALGGLFEMAGRFFLVDHLGLAPAHFAPQIIGASAGVYGIIAAYASLFAHRSINLLIPPIEIKVRTFLWFGIAFSLFGIIAPFGGMAHGAHLGGILTGLVYIHWITRAQKPLVVWQPFRPKARRRELVKVRAETPQAWQKPKPIAPEDLPPAEFISKEVDPILDKISAHGIQSLTERERQVLEAARKKMSKR